MPKTNIAFLIGGVGLAGIIPANGFFSKDAVLGMAFTKGLESGEIVYTLMGVAGLVTAVMTGFYFFRMYFRVFYGQSQVKGTYEEPTSTQASKPHQKNEHDEHSGTNPAEKGHHQSSGAHESPRLMTTPLLILAGLVLITGLLSLDGFLANLLPSLFPFLKMLGFGDMNLFNEHVLGEVLNYWPRYLDRVTEIDSSTWIGLLPLVALGFALTGVVLALLMYIPGQSLVKVRESFVSMTFVRSIDKLLVNKYYIDHFYLALAAITKNGLATGFVAVDNTCDGIIDNIGRKTVQVCTYATKADEKYIDGAVRGLSARTFRFAGRIRQWQSGVLQGYLRSLTLGFLIMLLLAYVLSLV